MRKRGKYFTTYVDIDDVKVEISVDDILSFVDDFDDEQLKELKKRIKVDEDINNLHDELKSKVLKKAFNKYSLEELMEKLDIKYNEF
jgi:DNA-directed RNA polymerase specialized sigma24 family protein